MELVEELLKGDRKAAARLISLVENASPKAREALRLIYQHPGHAHVVGVTGPSGVGKSCLIEKTTQVYRESGKTVGIIAVDPNSAFTGGAILGDRVRMQQHYDDEGVFIRSMSTRGFLGGLSAVTKDAVKILDAYGKDIIIIETAGVGQSEVDIINFAHTTLLTLMPGIGDEIQMLKAGILEIGDIFVVNKADLEGVERTVKELEDMLNMGQGKEGWKPPVLKTVASTGKGIRELVGRVQEHMNYMVKSKLLERKVVDMVENEVIELVTQKTTRHFSDLVKKDSELQAIIKKTVQREIDPYTASENILKYVLKTGAKANL